ncbi:3-methyl-2-oxobutanoate hydroxymethyltransferase [Actinomycetospora cinnamomea]|uniref:3-methyl-2-oxobutanoate hydroxymethyltransferase n=1 Tax=Actinomycetospora cinnamomea TaxID=663609 RepID=A0A2U1FA09_9PSEU|nr:3-methyl-2-oxobutanoate hydroxymethyltransferase [Actinomycetospora cinnamomea]PVZ09004.1 ketopantoate hydroxymethyltransferase [Actinomycetospora cinnamomea]
MTSPQAPATTPPGRPRRTRVHHLQEMKARGERWPMLTAYDVNTARIFDEAGVPVLLVGDSAGNTVLGYDTTVPVTTEELLVLTRAVVRGAPRALVVADLPFGSYQVSVEQAVTTAVEFMKSAGAHAVKLEGGAHYADRIRAVVDAGIPVMAHLGFTPQSEHALGGYRVQGRGDDGAEKLLADARAVTEAGAFAVVLEMVPAHVAKRVTAEVPIPTVGIGAGPECDAQVLVWTDMAGLSDPARRTPRFVKRYAEMGSVLADAASTYAQEVREGTFPGPEHSFD